MKRVRLVAALGSLMSFSVSCHYADLTGGQLALLNRQVPLRRALQDETDARRKQLLARVPDILHFARTVVQLEPGMSYTGYYATGSSGVTHVLSASERTRFEAYTWWFPIAGEVPYKSFFDEARARQEQATLQRAGYDTWLGQSTAYSTLGFLRDPLIDTMLQRGVIGLVDLLIHELSHARLYVPGETEFNEQLASFVGREGTLQYFRSRSDGDPYVMAAVNDHFDRKREVERLMERAVKQLEALYASGKEEAAVLRQRQAIFRRTERMLRRLYPEATVEELRINNARLLQFTRYAGSTEYLERLWREAGRNWVAFWPAVERYAEAL